jgi:hypothetical protein
MYLVLSALTSSPVSLRDTIKASAFYFITLDTLTPSIPCPVSVPLKKNLVLSLDITLVLTWVCSVGVVTVLLSCALDTSRTTEESAVDARKR